MYDYRSVVTFGGWNEDLMIVVNQLIESAPHHYEHRTDKLLFLLPKHKVNKYKNERCKYIHWNGIMVAGYIFREAARQFFIFSTLVNLNQLLL